MESTILLVVLTALVAALFSIIGWMGSRVLDKLDQMVTKLDDVKGELHTRINQIDKRLVRLETRAEDK